MLRQAWWTTLIVFGLLIIAPARATDAEIDRLLQSPVGKDWVTNGGISPIIAILH
jgi:quinohemoprotein ethanol dehydrogenase